MAARGKGRSGASRALIGLLIVGILVLIFVGWQRFSTGNWTEAGPSSKDVSVTVPEGASRADTAQAWLDAVGEVTMRQVTPGSKYENSFVRNWAAVGTGEPAGGLYDPELLAGEHFTFTNERIFVNISIGKITIFVYIRHPVTCHQSTYSKS